MHYQFDLLCGPVSTLILTGALAPTILLTELSTITVKLYIVSGLRPDIVVSVPGTGPCLSESEILLLLIASYVILTPIISALPLKP